MRTADLRGLHDGTALNAVRFEDGDEHIAHLTFHHGGSETVRGVAARSLFEYLTDGQRSENQSESAASDAEDTPSELSDPLEFNFTATSSGRSKGWFYNTGERGRKYIFAFVNAKGSCSVRPFDAEKNIALGKRYGSGPYQENFANLLTGATELFVDSQPNLERDCKERLPDRLLAYLRKQIDAINEPGA